MAEPGGTETRAAIAEVARRLATVVGAAGDTDRPAGPDTTPVFEPLIDGVGEPDDEVVGGRRLHAIGRSFGLVGLDLSLLIVAAAPALDARLVTVLSGVDPLRRGTVRVDTALTVAGADLWSGEHRARLGALAPLRRHRLLEVLPGEAGLLDGTIRVPDRVVAHLLGDDTPDPVLAPLLCGAAPVDVPAVGDVGRALASGVWSVWLRDCGGAARSVGATALAVLGAPAVVLDLDRLTSTTNLDDVLALAVREAGLIGGGVVAGPVDRRRDRAALAALQSAPTRPLVLCAPTTWDPTAATVSPVVIDVPPLDPIARQELWRNALTPLGLDDETALDLSGLRLSPDQIETVAAAARDAAVAAGTSVDRELVRTAALAHGSSRLVDLARRIEPRATFDDLVASAELLAELTAIPDRHRTRHRVRVDWGLDHSGGRGLGLTCLFAGPSGTGKTLAAEVVAHALGVDLFIIDLSQVVDKYIGETEKNLERVFQEAEGVNGVLLFDEADALFGKRSDVKSSHDRHANVEVAYLLQRMERYDGIAVLTTNLRRNIDEAFSRRLDVVCTFAEPDEAARLELWRKHLPDRLPTTSDLRLDLLAEHVVVAGGVIRNITLTAAHAAATREDAVSMSDLVAATAREFRKMGRLFQPGPLAPWVTEP